jgi:PAS domain S-box-containing protein
VEPSIAAETRLAAAIPSAGTNHIVAGAVRDFPPYFLDAPGSNPTGFAIDVLAETARRAGVTVEYRVFDSWKDAQAALRRGEIDLIPNMGVTRGRQDWIAFTPPYQSINVVLFVRADKPPIYALNDLQGKTIGVIATNTGRQLVKKIPKAREHVFPGVDDALRALLDGKIDALIYPADVVRYLAGKMGEGRNIRVTGPTLVQVERAMAVRADRAAMLMELEPHLRAYTGTKAYLDLYRRWFGSSSDETRISTAWRYVAVFAIMAIIIGAIVWQVRRSRMANGSASKHVASLGARLGNRLLVRFGLISLISVIGFLAIILYMYQVSFESTRAALAEAAETEASLVNAVLRFDKGLSAKNALPKESSALSEVLAALSLSYNNKMETLIAERRADHMLFLMRNRAPQDQMPDVVPLGSELAQPMQRALSGEMGTMIGRDYRGEWVLAAYRPVEALNGGLVTKMDVAEIRAPFLMAGTIVMIVGVGFALLGGYLSIRTTLPILQRASENEEHIRDIFEELPIAIWEEDWSAVRKIAVDRAVGTAGKPAGAAENDSDLLARLIEARTILDVSQGALSIHGGAGKEEEIARLGRLDQMRPGEVKCFRDLLAAFAAGKDFAQSDFALPDPATGGQKHIRARAIMPRHRRGDWSRVLRIETDRTGEHVAVAKISEREERFRQIAENLREVFWVANADKSMIEYVSPAYETVWGRNAEEVYRNPRAFLEAIHPEDRPGVIDALDRQVVGTYDIEYRIVRPDGEVRWIRDRAAPIADDAGKVYRIVGVADDITDIKKKDRDLQHAQKIEALGQLVGGIAHDFNNVLTIILGNLELLESRLRNPENHKLLTRVIEAARREGRMVDELLLFSRNHELKQERCDVNDLLNRMKELLQRTLGGAIETHTRFYRGLCTVNADVSYLQTAIINLAINARDAMPKGGHLIIETDVVDLDATFLARNSDATPGRFVMIAITDTGTGIPAANLPHVFEPFFTTKEAGKGTGMGLAMVYGFVKQSGGHISVYSEDRRGTSFKIYLPSAPAATKAEEPPSTETSKPSTLSGGSEMVLLVEDEELVRETAATLLKSLGYRVIEAASGPEAFEALKNHSDVDILFTDTVMPGGLTGLELARRVQKLNPGIKVLLTSGYLGDLSPRMRKYARLRKPYSAADLASALRRVLDADESAGGDRRHELHKLRYH